MAITLTTAARNAACDAVVDLIDAGAGAGFLNIKSAPSTVRATSQVAELTFSDPAFGDSASGTAAASAITSDTDADGGVASDLTLFDSDGNAVLQGSVGTSGADLNLSSTNIGAGDTVSVSSMTVTQPAA